MVPREGACRLCLPEDPRTCPYKVVVEEPLVEAALPPYAVERLERLPAGRGCEMVVVFRK